MTKRIVLVLLILIAILGYLYLDNIDPHSEKVISHIDTSPIDFGDDSLITFFESGFAVTRENKSSFYDYSGKPVDIPFEDENGSNITGTITDSTDNYIVVDNKYLYNTTSIPFKFILDFLRETAWAIEEFDNGLLLVAKAGDMLDVYILKGKDYSLDKVENMDDLSYITSSFAPSSDAFSIITIDSMSPAPSNKILHFLDAHSPYGVLDVGNEMYYKIFRQEDFFTLLGLHWIKCYDMIGTLRWEKNIPHVLEAQVLNLGKDLVLYFNNRYIEDRNNALAITHKGEANLLAMERGLHHLTRYKSHYIGVRERNNIIILGSRGDVAEEYKIDIDVDGIYWTHFSPETVFFQRLK